MIRLHLGPNPPTTPALSSSAFEDHRPHRMGIIIINQITHAFVSPCVPKERSTLLPGLGRGHHPPDPRGSRAQATRAFLFWNLPVMLIPTTGPFSLLCPLPEMLFYTHLDPLNHHISGLLPAQRAGLRGRKKNVGPRGRSEDLRERLELLIKCQQAPTATRELG